MHICEHWRKVTNNIKVKLKMFCDKVMFEIYFEI